MYRFLPELKASLKAAAEPYGFRTRKSIFERVVNDVYQDFYIDTFRKSSAGQECRIGFAVLPLSSAIQPERIERGTGLYYLRQFQDSFASMSWYVEADDDSKRRAVEEITACFTTYLLPFFEWADSCRTALQALIDFECATNRHYIEHYGSIQRRIWMDCAGFDSEEILNGLDPYRTEKYYLALKSGDYAMALKFARFEQLLKISNYELMNSRGEMGGERHWAYLAMLKESERASERLKAGDTAYFQKIIEENEAISRETLKHLL